MRSAYHYCKLLNRALPRSAATALSSSARSSACRSLLAASEEDTAPWPPANGRSGVSVCGHTIGARCVPAHRGPLRCDLESGEYYAFSRTFSHARCALSAPAYTRTSCLLGELRPPVQLGSQRVAFACTQARQDTGVRPLQPSAVFTLFARHGPRKEDNYCVAAHNTNAGVRATGARVTSGGVQRSLQLALLRDEELAHLRGQPELLVAFGIAGRRCRVATLGPAAHNPVWRRREGHRVRNVPNTATRALPLARAFNPCLRGLTSTHTK